jgi:hypothetical protein
VVTLFNFLFYSFFSFVAKNTDFLQQNSFCLVFFEKKERLKKQIQNFFSLLFSFSQFYFAIVFLVFFDELIIFFKKEMLVVL